MHSVICKCAHVSTQSVFAIQGPLSRDALQKQQTEGGNIQKSVIIVVFWSQVKASTGV